jgi:hypothetical protein
MARPHRRDQASGDIRPSLLFDGDAPDLESILNTVYRAPRGGASRSEDVPDSDPPVEIAQPLVTIDEASPWRAEVQRRRKRRSSPLGRRRRATESGAIYLLWVATLAALVFALLLLAENVR